MKTITAALLLAGILAGSASGGITLGVLGGLDFANVSGDSVENNEIKTGFTVGAFLDVPVSPSISIRPELLYVVNGTRLDAGALDASVDLTYLDVPVLVRYEIPMTPVIAPILFAGPYLGINLDAQAVLEGVAEDIKDEIASTDYGLVVGAGVEVPVGQGEICFDAQYMLGLANIDDTDVDEVVKNTGILLLAGYGFSL